MANYEYCIEQFSLATIEGEEALHIDIALDIEYDHRGNWKIITVGAVQNWGGPPPIYKQYTNDIVWFQQRCPLEKAIIDRVYETYSDRIDERICREARDEMANDYEEQH